jgi:hypothetical protein
VRIDHQSTKQVPAVSDAFCRQRADRAAALVLAASSTDHARYELQRSAPSLSGSAMVFAPSRPANTCSALIL